MSQLDASQQAMLKAIHKAAYRAVYRGSWSSGGSSGSWHCPACGGYAGCNPAVQKWSVKGEVIMVRDNKPASTERVACEVCMKEVPQSEAVVPEAVGYVVYFCGLDCYENWKNQCTKTGARLTPGS